MAAGPEGPQGVPRHGEGRSLHRRGLRLHPQGRREAACRAAPRRWTSRTRSTPTSGAQVRGRQGEREDRPPALQAQERRSGRDAHQPAGAPLEGLAHLREDQPRPAAHPRLHQVAAAREEPAAGPRASGARVQALRAEPQQDAQGGRALKQARRGSATAPRRTCWSRSATARCSRRRSSSACSRRRSSRSSRQGGGQGAARAAVGAGRAAQHRRRAGAQGRRQEERQRRRGGGRHRRRAGALRPLLQPGARRRHRGFITRGRGVTVHTTNCEKALATDPERRVEVQLGRARRLQAPGHLAGADRRSARACWPTSRRPSARRASTSARPTAAPPATIGR